MATDDLATPPPAPDGIVGRVIGTEEAWALESLPSTMVVVGSMIGSGIFIVSAESSRLVGSPGWLLAVWAVAGLMTITGALCCAELAAMMPRAGGQYVFLREAYGRATAFVFGWSMLLVIQTGTIAAVAIAFASFTGVLFPGISSTTYLVEPVIVGQYAFGLSTQQLLAIASILFLTWANTRGLQLGKLIQNLFTVAKTAALAGLIIVGLTIGWNADSAAYTSSWWNPWANGWTPEGVEAAVREVADGAGVKLGKLAQPLRAALTGRTTSPGIFDVLALLGQGESLARISDQMEPDE